MILRPYQKIAFDAVIESLNEHPSTLVVMPTGTGKTVLFAMLAQHYKQFGRVKVIAHRDELIRQAAEKIKTITGEAPDIEMNVERADEHFFDRSKVIVGSVQTLCAGRVNRFDPKAFSLLITDEAHHATASSYRKVYKHMLSAGCKHLGVTATPDRSDEEALGQIFGNVAYVYEIQDAIKDGWLVPIRQHLVPVEGLDYSGAKTTAGDLNQGDIAKAQASEKVLHGFIDPIIREAGTRKTLVFAAPGSAKGEGEDYHIAERMTEIFNRYKPGSARRVSQDTNKEDRRQILADFRAGKFQFLINVGVFTEGFDEPGIEVVAITRPTKSRPLYAQEVGRGTRPLPGLVDQWPEPGQRRDAIHGSAKPHLDVLDFVGNSGKHKLVTTADILGGKYPDEVVARAKKKAEKGAVDMSVALEESLQEIHEQNERARKKREAVTAKATYRLQAVDPFEVFDVEPNRIAGWDKGQWASPKQVALLRQFKVDIPPDLTKGRAGQLIDQCYQRKAQGKASYAQAKALRERGLPSNMTAGEAAIRLGDSGKFAKWNQMMQERMSKV